MSIQCEKCGADISFESESHPNCETVQRLRAEVADEREQSQNFYRTMVAVEADRDRLRELLLRVKSSVYDPGPVLVADINAALKEQKK